MSKKVKRQRWWRWQPKRTYNNGTVQLHNDIQVGNATAEMMLIKKNSNSNSNKLQRTNK